MRCVIALNSDTGRRLGKAAGFRLTHIKLDAAIVHIDFQSHPRRSLKKRGSQRLISLVGGLLWAAERLADIGGDNVVAFPSYFNERGCSFFFMSRRVNKRTTAKK